MWSLDKSSRGHTGWEERSTIEAIEVKGNETMVMYGPMQLLVVGFPGNEFSGEILPAINDVREKGLIRMIDYVFAAKSEKGDLVEIEGTDLGPTEVEQLGALVGGLIGLGAGGAEGAREGAEIGEESASEIDNEMTYGLSEEDIDDMVDSIPNNTSAVFAVIEHLWAKDIKQAVIDSNGTVLVQGMLTPELMVRIGEVVSGAVAQQ